MPLPDRVDLPAVPREAADEEHGEDGDRYQDAHEHPTISAAPDEAAADRRDQSSRRMGPLGDVERDTTTWASVTIGWPPVKTTGLRSSSSTRGCSAAS